MQSCATAPELSTGHFDAYVVYRRLASWQRGKHAKVRPGRLRFVAVTAAVVALVGACGAVLLTANGTDSAGGSARAAVPGSSACTKTLLHDWSDGRIDGTYPIGCYRSALSSLPADLEVYSSAADDISQALSARIVQSRAQKISGHQGCASPRKSASARSTAPGASSSTRPARASSRNVMPPR